MNKKSLGLYALLISFLSVLFVGINTNEVKAASVNDYIVQYKLQPVSIQYREGTFTHWFGYENGVGKPEGVVVHETADNSATAENEATFFNWDWPNIESYVHAFVDSNEIINIHNTDYGVWGAGQTANAKYVQVELCRTNDYDKFARSVANDAYYIASKLIQYNLPDTPGVTVKSHHQVAQEWHETNHVDPDTYFATKWGYNMNQLNDLVGLYYKNLKNTGSVYGNTNNSGNNANTNSGNNTSIKVNNSNGDYVPIVAFQSNGSVKTVRNRALANNTDWRTDKTQNYGGVTYHRVATNEWVDAGYIVK